MPKAAVHRTKPSRVDYNDLDIICRIEAACEAVHTGQSPNLKAASREFDINYGTLRNRYHSLHQPSKQAFRGVQVESLNRTSSQLPRSLEAEYEYFDVTFQ